MSAVDAGGGGGGPVRAFEAAIAAATARLEAMAEAASDATKTQREKDRQSRETIDTMKQIGRAALGPIGEVAAAGALRGYGAMAGQAEEAALRMMSYVPGIGDLAQVALTQRDLAANLMMQRLGPAVAAGGKPSPEALELIGTRALGQARRMTQAGIDVSTYLNEPRQKARWQQDTGIDDWKWMFGEWGRTINRWLEDVGLDAHR